MKPIRSKSSVPRNSNSSNTMLSLEDVVRIILDRLSPSQDATYRIFVHNFNSKLIGKCEFVSSCLHLFGNDEYLKLLFTQVANYQIKLKPDDKAFSISNQERNNNIDQIQEDHYKVPSHDQKEDEMMENELEKQGRDFLNKIERVVESKVFQSVLHTLIGYKEGKIRVHMVKAKILWILSNHEDLIEELDEILKNMEAIIVIKKSKKRKRSSSPSPNPNPNPSPKKVSHNKAGKSDCGNDMFNAADVLKSGVKNGENVEDMEVHDAAVLFYCFVRRVHEEFGDK